MIYMVSARKRAVFCFVCCALSVTPALLAADAERQPVTQEQIKGVPRLTMTDKELTEAESLRSKTIASIHELLRNDRLAAARRFELYLRLGELFAERADFLRDFEIKDYESRYDKWQSGGKTSEEPKLSHKKSFSELGKAADAYREIVRRYPQNARTDAALYSLAKILNRLDQDSNMGYFEQLIKNFPKSPFVPDSLLSLGDSYFDKRQMSMALSFYKKACEYKTHPAYAYAIYKLAWTYYNLKPDDEAQASQNLAKSLTAFKLVVELADNDKSKDSGNITLRNEAVQDLVMVWAEIGDVDAAWTYFEKIDEQKSFYTMLERLGNLYFDHGDFEKTLTVFERILADDPLRPSNPKIYEKILKVRDATNQSAMIPEDLKKMRELFVDSSTWVTKNQSSLDLLKEVRDSVAFNSHFYATTFHERGNKTKESSWYGLAKPLYELYLDLAPNAVQAYEVRYYHADVLYELKEYEKAAAAYAVVADLQPQSGKYLKSSLENAVAALSEADALVPAPLAVKLGSIAVPLPIPAVKQKLVDAMDHFVRLLPSDEEGYPMLYTAADIKMQYGHYEDGLKRFEELIRKIPQTNQATAGLRIVMSYYITKEQWEECVAWVEKFKKTPAMREENLSQVVTELYHDVLLKRSIALEKKEKFHDAAKSYMVLTAEFPKHSEVDKYLYQAAALFFKAGEVESAVAGLSGLLEKFPKSSLYREALADLAQTYEASADFKKAQALYQRFSEKFPLDKRGAKSLFNAALLNWGLDHNELALTLMRRFTTNYKEHELTASAQLYSAKILERLERYGDASNAYRSYLEVLPAESRDERLFARAKLVALHNAYPNEATEAPYLSDLEGELLRKDAPAALEARRIIGEIKFKQLENDFERFKAIKIDDPAKLESQAKKKQNMLVGLARRYQRVVSLRSAEYASAAFFRIGQMHEDFYETLMSANPPTNASDEERQTFKAEIEKVALPLRSEALEFYRNAHKTVQEYETVSKWGEESYRKLSELAFEQYPTVKEKVLEPKYMSQVLF
jgi:tetratricopeptide (TPR) repeat protein